MASFIFGALVAADAGHVAHVGDSDAPGWSAPELLAPTVLAQPCSQSGAMKSRQLVFEMLSPATIDDEMPLFGAAGREVVSFEWNASTGELSYDTSAPTAVFSDLVSSSQPSADPHPNRGSR